jgi:16S rRNA (cytosine1402-N4)-methyltransferase
MNELHQPVMLQQAIDLLNVRPGLTYVDATAGAGGHLSEILRRTAGQSTVFGIDRDLESLDRLRSRFGEQVRFAHSNYDEIGDIIEESELGTVSGGILADLGVSSMQLDNPDRGFSFLQEGPLDMRMDPTAHKTAEELVNSMSEKDLANIIYQYGEERHSRNIARRIVEARPIKSTRQLAEIVTRSIRKPPGRGRNRDTSHPATRTFQALRIAVNDELASLERFLRSSIKVLSPGARLVVITFHSLEDRIVKQILRDAAAACVCPPRQPVCTCHRRPELLIITRKPVIPDEQEVLANPRSRSAKLRAGEKLS